MFDVIDDDEWFELSLALNDTLAKLPRGSRVVEALEIPAFRPAVRASGQDMPAIETVPYVPGQATAQEAIKLAMRLASRRTVSPRPGALTITITQTDDGATIAMVVAGLPGEQCSFSSFDLRPGSHNIDVGFEALAALNGWAYRADQGPSLRSDAA